MKTTVLMSCAAGLMAAVALVPPALAQGPAPDCTKDAAAAGCPIQPTHAGKHARHHVPPASPGNPNGTGVANGRTGGQPLPNEPLPAQPQAQPTPSQ